ncbi:MAG: UDP-3-O-(3-hydroxymyristoyl)glucosamine N-acyltransferase [Bacteroidia bacterium]|nr:UDP-3-O-(3-hydroxymyristoyl)glucosamine N-acyltransferase [Bacteroidia bacterium]MCZ2276970.1 UDP-3-O-(3-hydroxymyristoyl)glucosamine N-acyltransferase [Bacteroidia bacterium]
MKFTAEQIAVAINGSVVGDKTVQVTQFAKIEEGREGSLCFIARENLLHHLEGNKASVIILNESFEIPNGLKATLIRVKDAHTAFVRLLQLYHHSNELPTGIDGLACIHPSAKLGKNVWVGAFSFIGKGVELKDGVKVYPNVFIDENVVIGEKTILHAGVKVYQETVIGNECVIHSGTVIGADGFGFAPSGSSFEKVPQTGNVVIKDRVEIGANTTIDRATLGSTLIHEGVKLDNLIQIAHNVEIGENTVIAAQTGIAGSAKIGKNCMIGGQVGIVGHISIADGVKIAAQSGIGSSIDTPGTIVQGSPAFGIGDYKRAFVIFKKLPLLEQKINEFEKALAAFRNSG